MGEIQSNTRDGHNDFSSKVHVLAGTLVLIMSTNTWWFNRSEVLHEPRPHVGHHKNLSTS